MTGFRGSAAGWIGGFFADHARSGPALPGLSIRRWRRLVPRRFTAERRSRHHRTPFVAARRIWARQGERRETGWITRRFSFALFKGLGTIRRQAAPRRRSRARRKHLPR